MVPDGFFQLTRALVDDTALAVTFVGGLTASAFVKNPNVKQTSTTSPRSEATPEKPLPQEKFVVIMICFYGLQTVSQELDVESHKISQAFLWTSALPVETR